MTDETDKRDFSCCRTQFYISLPILVTLTDFSFPQGVQGVEGGDRDMIYSDEEEEYSSQEEGSDSEPTMLEAPTPSSQASR